MALADECLARWSTARAVQLTNPDDPTGSGVNAARLALAVADVSGEFRAFAGVAYTPTLPEHVALAVEGVEIYLKRYQGRAEAGDLADWRGSLRALMEQYAYVDPTTTSSLQPSTDLETLGPSGRPDFDDSRLRNYRPLPSGNGSSPFGNG